MLLGKDTTVLQVATKDGVKTYVEQDGVSRRVAARPPPLPCLIHPNPRESGEWDFSKSSDGGTDVAKPPVNLNRSAAAFWWSVLDLLQHDTCYFWTVTMKERQPDSYFGNMHGRFMRNMGHAAASGRIHEWWGGVRVFEPHPGGHGLHSHLILRNRMPWEVVKDCAELAGLGRVNVHPKKVELPLVRYLCKYLTKSAKEMSGVRRWACVGTYDGVGKRDVVFSGTRADRIKVLAQANRVRGMHRYVAFRIACMQYEEECRDALYGPKENPRSGKIFTLDKSQPF